MSEKRKLANDAKEVSKTSTEGVKKACNNLEKIKDTDGVKLAKEAVKSIEKLVDHIDRKLNSNNN